MEKPEPQAYRCGERQIASDGTARPMLPTLIATDQNGRAVHGEGDGRSRDPHQERQREPRCDE